VGLIGVAEVGGEPCPVDGLPRRHPVGHLPQAVAADHPLRPDADVVGEEPLQPPDAHAEIGRQRIGPGDPPIVGDAGDDVGDRLRRRVALRQVRAQEFLDDPAHLGGVAGRRHRDLGHLHAEDLARADGSIGDHRHRPAQERAEPTWAEGHPEDASTLLECAEHVPAGHAVDPRDAVDERQVHVRVRDDQLPVRRLP
jgi:hypothetical protein